MAFTILVVAASVSLLILIAITHFVKKYRDKHGLWKKPEENEDQLD
jgi:hypothetical protein